MKFKNKFNLSHVAGFFVGVVVTVAFNWIVFKEPKRVTAPGVAALVAICTFTLALWSAFKVNKWVASKVNEKAFKRTEEFLDAFIKLSLNIAQCYAILKLLKKYSGNNLKSQKNILRSAKVYFPSYLETITTIHALQFTFKNWGISFLYERSFKHILSRLSHVTRGIRILNEMLIHIEERDNSDLNFDIMNENIKNTINYIESCMYPIDGFVKKNIVSFLIMYLHHLQKRLISSSYHFFVYCQHLNPTIGAGSLCIAVFHFILR